MADNEKISVLVPVYNEEKYLNQCIESVVNQKYQNWELILIDDGSCVVNEYCKPSIDGVGTYSKEQTKYRVLKRLDQNHVQILIL